MDTQYLQVFGNADTDVNASRRIVKLTSPLVQRFYVGAPPSITGIGGLVDGNYSRDTDILTVTGSGLGHVTSLEIVDRNGNPIAGVPGIGSGPTGQVARD